MKFIAGAATGALVAATLTFAGAPAATAAPNYGGKTQTNCSVVVILKNGGKRVTIKPRVRVPGEGTINAVKVLKLKKNNKKKAFAKTRLSKKAKRVSFKLPKKGKKIKVIFKAKKTGKKYKNCRAVLKFRR